MTTLSIPVILFLLLLLLALSFFFSLSETSLIGLSKIRLRHMVAQGIKRAKRVYDLTLKLDKVIAAILIGNNFANIAISAIVTGIFVEVFGYKLGIVLATFITTLIVLIFCEITPKILATKLAEKIALFTAPFLESVVRILDPIISVFVRDQQPYFKAVEGRASQEVAPHHRRRIADDDRDRQGRRSIKRRREEDAAPDLRIRGYQGERGNGTERKDGGGLHQLVPPGTAGHIRRTRACPPACLQGCTGQYRRHNLRPRPALPFERQEPVFTAGPGHQAYCVPEEMRVNELLRVFQADKVQIAIVIDQHAKVAAWLRWKT